uniref:Arginase n=1 Tax=Odontella aurita TaxID=265563 RepID=A0A7S4I5R3_9STRA|mmetsp:Transcript_20377/g.58946  ORF Transcript_20377/g.58946 Transcript_20377/m.58946 type:complete len:404 (+) Transcript_20377:203-1414(+)
MASALVNIAPRATRIVAAGRSRSCFSAPSAAAVAAAVGARSYSASRSVSAVGDPGSGYRVHDPMIPTCDDEGNVLFHHTPDPKTVSIIGAPMTFGQPFVGTDHGPRLLREAGLLSDLSTLGWRVHDCSDLDFDLLSSGVPSLPSSGDAKRYADRARHSRIVGKGCQVLADRVEDELNKGRFPLILGGDHSVGLGSLSGILRVRPNVGVIWVDAHADLNTPSMSESGNMHGMPVGLLMAGLEDELDRATIPGLEWLSDGDVSPAPRLNPDSIVYVGLRDVDRAERSALRQLNIRTFTMHDIDCHGIGAVMSMALEHLLQSDPDRPLHLSYDIDAIDPVHAPATGTAVRGGLTYREAHYIAESVARSGALGSVEMVELNPTLSDGEGSRETVELGEYCCARWRLC